jgi:hypothetical protein
MKVARFTTTLKHERSNPVLVKNEITMIQENNDDTTATMKIKPSKTILPIIFTLEKITLLRLLGMTQTRKHINSH